MDTLPSAFGTGRLGDITAETDDLSGLVGPDGQRVAGIKYDWHPSPELTVQLPDGFHFPMRCLVGPDGLRRFYPSSFEGQIAGGFLGGLAILTLVGNLDPEQRHSYRATYMLFERVRRTREHLGNSLLNATSLRVSRVGRDVAEERTILPASLGQNARGEGEPWSVDQLLREGREAAVAAGVQRPSEEDCVHYGFIAAARRNPLHLSQEEVLTLVRMALYESIPLDEPLEPDLVDLVVERTLTALQGHLGDQAGDFNAWFSGPKNSFVQQIARRKLLPGGVLDRDQVRRALLELGWEAYNYVADCIHAMMRVFQQLLPEPLSATEASWFEQMHLKQPHFGNLPVVLLVERFRFVREVLWEIWENPGDPEPIAVLHRLLSYYAEMASARRELDRKVKQRRLGGNASGTRTPLTVPLPEVTPADPDSDSETNGEDEDDDEGGDPTHASPAEPRTAEVFASVAEAVRADGGLRCSCAEPAWNERVVRQDSEKVTIRHDCTSCGFSADTTLSLQRVKELARKALQ